MHLPSCQQMDVKVVDSLSAIGSGVDDESKTIVEMLQCCNFVGSEQQFAVDICFGQ